MTDDLSKISKVLIKWSKVDQNLTYQIIFFFNFKILIMFYFSMGRIVFKIMESKNGLKSWSYVGFHRWQQRRQFFYDDGTATKRPKSMGLSKHFFKQKSIIVGAAI
jgi:hypothetical protein